MLPAPDALEESLAVHGTVQATPEVHDHVEELSVGQTLLYGVGGIAGGLIFTMLNNALPLFLRSYTMPFGLPGFFTSGGPVPASIVALLTNERSLLGGLIQPLVGHLSDRTKSRLGKRGPYVLVGGLGAAICVGLLAFQPPFWVMVFAVTLSGVWLYVAQGPYTSLLADIAPFEQRGRIGGLIAIAGMAGSVVFTVLSALLWEQSRGWVFVLTALGVALSLAVVAFGVRELHPHLGATHHGAKHPGLWRAVLADRPLAFYVLSMAIFWLGAGAASPFITRFGVVELGISESEAFILLLPIAFATAVGAVVSGWLADRRGRKRVLQYTLGLFSVTTLVAAAVQNLPEALPVMVFVGLCNGAMLALHLPLLADLVPRARAGAFMGFASMVWSVGQPLGSLLAGGLADITGSYRTVFLLAGVCMVGAMLTLFAVRTHGRLPAN